MLSIVDVLPRKGRGTSLRSLYYNWVASRKEREDLLLVELYDEVNVLSFLQVSWVFHNILSFGGIFLE
jgi:hypothetical protein